MIFKLRKLKTKINKNWLLFHTKIFNWPYYLWKISFLYSPFGCGGSRLTPNALRCHFFVQNSVLLFKRPSRLISSFSPPPLQWRTARWWIIDAATNVHRLDRENSFRSAWMFKEQPLNLFGVWRVLAAIVNIRHSCY